MDPIAKQLLYSVERYTLAYAGFENGIFRSAPYMRSEWMPEFSGTYPDGIGRFVGYDPRKRGWYYSARRSLDTAATTFTPPYVDASSQELVISVMQPTTYASSEGG